MRGILVVILGAWLVVVGSISVALAQQQTQDYAYSADVFIDVDANSSWDATEVRAAGWTIELYDDSFNLLSSTTSSDAAAVETTSTDPASYICIQPQTDWLQTVPLAGPSHPLDFAWYYYDLASDDAVEVYTFGVAEDEGTPEPGGEIIEEENTEPTEKVVIEDEGAVLGATDEPEILAETGSESWLMPIVGVILIISVIPLARASVLDYNRLKHLEMKQKLHHTSKLSVK